MKKEVENTELLKKDKKVRHVVAYYFGRFIRMIYLSFYFLFKVVLSSAVIFVRLVFGWIGFFFRSPLYASFCLAFVIAAVVHLLNKLGAHY